MEEVLSRGTVDIENSINKKETIGNFVQLPSQIVFPPKKKRKKFLD